jgi:hypothetical protein
MTVLLVVLVTALTILSGFLGKEFLKKFAFMRDFIKTSNQSLSWYYQGDRKPGMYTIVLRAKKPFSALVGFRLDIPILGYSGFDYYGFVQARQQVDGQYVAVVSTYMAGGEVEFQFFVNSDLGVNPINVSSSDEDQSLTPGATFPPHLYQRIGFYS